MKILFPLLVLSLMITGVNAQDGKAHLKSAEKSMKNYLKGSMDDLASYQAALGSFDAAFKDGKISSDAKNWIKKGNLFNDLTEKQIQTKLIQPDAVVADTKSGVVACESYMKALDIATKGGDIKNAVKGLSALEGTLSNVAVQLYKEKNYADAFYNFDATIKAKDKLVEQGESSRLDDPVLYNDQIFFTSVSAYFANMIEESKPYLMILLELEENLPDSVASNKPFAYEALYKIYTTDGEEEKALKLLNEGRTLFPDDTGLLFAEINFYLEAGRNLELIEKLKIAREKEPENVSVVTTLGNVYDQLSVTAREEGNAEKADEYFGAAEGYYNEVLAVNKNDFTATYSIGALYYNKAAAMTEGINALANDFTKEGSEKYTRLKEEMDGYFEEAMPYFLAAEQIDNQDLNTLIALREIYARNNQFDKVTEYKDKYDAAAAKASEN